MLEPLDIMFRMNGMPRAQGCKGAAMARLAALIPLTKRGAVNKLLFTEEHSLYYLESFLV